VRAALLLAIFAAGCVTKSLNTPDDFGIKDVQLRLQCDHATLTVPVNTEPVEIRRMPGMPYMAVAAGVAIECRETPPKIIAGGEDISVVAEGTVLVKRYDGKREFEEGPYRLVIYRNGQILTR
jgi:hypothetical protein